MLLYFAPKFLSWLDDGSRIPLAPSPQERLGHSDVRQHMTPSPCELWLLRFPTGGLTPVNNVIDHHQLPTVRVVHTTASPMYITG